MYSNFNGVTAKTVDIKTNRMTAKAGHINKTSVWLQKHCSILKILE